MENQESFTYVMMTAQELLHCTLTFKEILDISQLKLATEVLQN